ncbi:NDE1, mitochondrial external NADH dehydrogenase [Exidia glandulosa HHB12029]|uniref:NDE1, mitochondrial external NADH dehydrogenase n=1 Tax=Exidia glandulosa HHB12029 TaxID=1314781 RepID=A0A165MAS0_EXIGL|nr:NDE1, mitochondrial external NADH dehydrogenase [Exidia glandulosa HHB12029]
MAPLTNALTVLRRGVASSSSATAKKRLVILGSGWGGYGVLRGIDKKKWDVTVVCPTNAFTFTPLLASCAVGTLEFRTALEPVRRFSPQITAYQAWCDEIDFKNQTLLCMPVPPPTSYKTSLSQARTAVLASKTPNAASVEKTAELTPFTIPYDKLVISVGAYSQTFGIPGVKDHAFVLRNVDDARAIRSHILNCFEQANLPTTSETERKRLLNFCIVGGGPTGVEFAAELHDLLGRELKKAYPKVIEEAKITVYDVAPQILGSFDSGLVDYAVRRFAREGIRIKGGRHIERVGAKSIFIKEEGEVPYGMLVWSTGLAPNPLITAISAETLQKDPKASGLMVNNALNVLQPDGASIDNVFAIGDAAVLESGRLPATAQVASQQAAYVANKLNREVKGKSGPDSFKFVNRGMLAYLGDWRAIYDRTSAKGLYRKETGTFAWLLWRSAYFTMTLSTRNKILIPVYWFLNWVTGRDITKV